MGPEPNPQPWPLTNSDRAASPVERGHQVGEPELLRTPIMDKGCSCRMIVRSCQNLIRFTKDGGVSHVIIPL